MTCVECGRAMVPGSSRNLGLRHAGRGLCKGCYCKVRNAGRLADYERANHAADEVLDEWVTLRDEGHTVPQAAARLGMTPHAMFAALLRAQRRGDPRAVFTWTGYKAFKAGA